MADQLLTDEDVFGGNEELLSDADVFGTQKAPRRGGTRAEIQPGVSDAASIQARADFAARDPRRVDIAKTPGQLLEQPNALDISGRLQAEREQLSQSPAAIERARQQALYDARASRPMQEARPLEITNRLTSDLRESVSNPALRGVVAGAAGLGKVGTGAVRLGADLVGAEDVSKFAAGAEGRASAVERGATQDLKGNDKLVADVFASITASAPSTVLAVMGGPALPTLFAQSALSEYGAGRDAGFGVAESATRAGIMGMAEAVGERFGLSEQVKLLKSMAKQLPTGELAKVFGSMLTKEIPGEQLTTALQFMADKAGPAALNPNATLDQYLEAAGETLKVTIGQTLVMGGGPAAIGTVRNEYQRTDAQRGAPIQAFLTPPQTKPLPPTQLRAEAIKRFDEMAAQFGMSPKSVAAAKQAASEMPAGEVPGFLGRMAEALQKRGLVAQPIDEQGLAGLTEALDGKPETPAAAENPEGADAVAEIEAALRQAGALPGEALSVPGLTEATPETPVDAVWLSAEADVPVKAIGPTQTGPDGREYTPVIGPDGTESFLPADELIEADRKAADDQPVVPDAAGVAAGSPDGRGAAAARSSGDPRPAADGAGVPAGDARPREGSAGPGGAVADGGVADGALTFKTAKGSVYTVNKDGTTTRNKAARNDVGHEGDAGMKEPSQRTFYVDPAGAFALGEFQTQGGKKRIVVRGGQAAMQYDDGPSAGKVERRTLTAISDKPAVGMIPVELWKDGTVAHFGNEITEVGGAPDAAAPVSTKAPAKAGATEAAAPSEDIAAALQDDPAPEPPTREARIADARRRIDGLKALLSCLST